ncbi:MAG: IS1595 family transposase [Rickettsiaceae bacterium]
MKNFKNLIDFTNFFKTEEKCHKYLKSILWQEGKYCPFCGCNKIHEYESNFKKNRCYSCKQDFSIRKGSIFGDSRLPLKKWFICIYLINSNKKGISSCQLANQVTITQKSAWFVLQRIREASQSKDFNNPFNGITEIDEAYIADKEETQHAKDKKLAEKKEKAVVIGLVSRDTKQVKAMKVINSEAEHLLPQIYIDVADKSTTTDSLQAYKPPKKHCNHKAVKHSAGEYIKNDLQVAFKIHTNTIKSFWGELKRGIRRIYHWNSHKHMQKYCNKFLHHYNNRNLKNNERFVEALNVLANTKLIYKTLTA